MNAKGKLYNYWLFKKLLNIIVEYLIKNVNMIINWKNNNDWSKIIINKF